MGRGKGGRGRTWAKAVVAMMARAAREKRMVGGGGEVVRWLEWSDGDGDGDEVERVFSVDGRDWW